MKKLIASLALVASLVAVPTSGPAEAAFSNCNWDIGWARRSAHVQCWTNTGPIWASYRVKLKCAYNNGGIYYAYGPWRTAGGWSGANCGGLGYLAKYFQTTG